jgi:hypothetical protein
MARLNHSLRLMTSRALEMKRKLKIVDMPIQTTVVKWRVQEYYVIFDGRHQLGKYLTREIST